MKTYLKESGRCRNILNHRTKLCFFVNSFACVKQITFKSLHCAFGLPELSSVQLTIIEYPGLCKSLGYN